MAKGKVIDHEAAHDKEMLARLDNMFKPLKAQNQKNKPAGIPSGAIWVDVTALDDNPFQPRQSYDEAKLKTLSDSLNEQGQSEAVPARPSSEPGRWELAAGHRRKRCILGGANAGPVEAPNRDEYAGKMLIIPRDLTDEQMLEVAFDENEEREPFSPLDLAHYYQSKIDFAEAREGRKISPEALAELEELNIKPRMIRNLLDILKLPQTIQDQLPLLNLSKEEGAVERANEKHYRAFLTLQPGGQSDPEAKPTPAQKKLLTAIENEKLSGNEALRRAAQLKPTKGKAATTGDSSIDADNDAGGSAAGQGSVSRETTAANPIRALADGIAKMLKGVSDFDTSKVNSSQARQEIAAAERQLKAAQLELKRLKSELK